MLADEDTYAVLRSRDGRFDGRFFVAVVTTGVYCRPSCPAALPKRENVRFYRSSAAALEAGFRACKRCRPDTTPGSPEWNVRADVTGRAMQLIADGLVDREGVGGLAAKLGYSERQLRRQLTTDLGAGPQALARAQRAANARTLLETTDLPASEIAFAAGFSTIRQFNDTLRKVYGTTPTALRGSRPANHPPGVLHLRLAYRPPIDLTYLFAYLAERAIPGLEEATTTSYRRALTLPHGLGLVTLRPAKAYVSCELRLDDYKDLAAAVRRCRRLLDLDADPRDIADHLTQDPHLADSVMATPGRRVPGTVDPAEMAIRAIANEETPAGKTLLTHLIHTYGTPVHGIHAFPLMHTLTDPDLPPPITAMATALTTGTVNLGPEADRDQAERDLRTLPGIQEDTIARIRMRAFGDPDVFLPADPAVQEGLHRLGLTAQQAHRWRPWRSYAMHHLITPGPPHCPNVRGLL
ncbi:AraC family transcriptional regulator, regulatory protein of adaptative response / DNA-3-methyladenine glycosylase II [Nonomuraea solani]|uniref:AraC family transcriptional regulator, regulatory protein of adaptative response / DNA-3-methyladenine glycosylase II n=1 Tax=Nonomuraea solani TaxID=1144553 RepID=A0A1H6CZJ6_9ACTN|nr:AlkA N-terminal domain-containing protein [Nonomuraea solani]SEG78113.1 AraC family transcriptional regulator, regulatory protein of adaptative response / DNA-3-methyladenine glycosylase II [Nonomuraea solani]